jgi:outer membrane protein assembly factor BamB
MKLMRFIPVIGLLLFQGPAVAGNWGNWRGPHFDGSTEETGLPAVFSPKENCLWSAPMPGPAASTPVVWEDNVFVTSTDEKAQQLLGICLDRKSGAVRWSREIGKGFRQDDKSTLAGPSPVTDGERVIFFFGSGDLAAFDFAGKLLWKRQIQEEYGSFAFLWTFSTSPVLHGGKLFLQVLQRDTSFDGIGGGRRGKEGGGNESYLLALDPATGKEIWRTVRPSEANAESLESFSTPMPYTFKGREELLVTGGDVMTGHDLLTGNELWRSPSWNPEKISHWRLVPGPVAGDGVILACAPKRAPVYAYKAGGSGFLTEADAAWVSGDAVNSQHVSSDVATPLFYRGRFYVMNSDRKALACLEPGTGKLFWEYRVEGAAKIESSPVGADGKVFFMDQRGTVTALAAGDEAKLLHQAEFGDAGQKDIRSSPVVAQGCLFVRTNAALFCVGTAGK